MERLLVMVLFIYFVTNVVLVTGSAGFQTAHSASSFGASMFHMKAAHSPCFGMAKCIELLNARSIIPKETSAYAARSDSTIRMSSASGLALRKSSFLQKSVTDRGHLSIGERWRRIRNAKSFPHFVAGLVAGTVECFVGHPLDTIRVIAMTKSNSELRASKSVTSALLSCFTPRGFLNIYRGSTSEMLSSAVAGSMIFGVNDILRRVFGKSCEDDDITKVDGSILLSAGITGFVDGFASKPFEIVKLRQQVEPTESVPSSFLDSYRSLYDEGGVGLFFRGWLPTVLRETIGNIAFFATYHQVKISLQNIANNELRKSTRERKKSHYPSLLLKNSTIVLLAGAAAGFAYCITSQPLEMASILMQADVPTKVLLPTATGLLLPTYRYKYTSMTQCFQLMVAEEGFGSLFKGIVPTVLRALPTHAAALYGYEKTLIAIHKWDSHNKSKVELRKNTLA